MFWSCWPGPSSLWWRLPAEACSGGPGAKLQQHIPAVTVAGNDRILWHWDQTVLPNVNVPAEIGQEEIPGLGTKHCYWSTASISGRDWETVSQPHNNDVLCAQGKNLECAWNHYLSDCARAVRSLMLSDKTPAFLHVRRVDTQTVVMQT